MRGGGGGGGGGGRGKTGGGGGAVVKGIGTFGVGVDRGGGTIVDDGSSSSSMSSSSSLIIGLVYVAPWVFLIFSIKSSTISKNRNADFFNILIELTKPINIFKSVYIILGRNLS